MKSNQTQPLTCQADILYFKVSYCLGKYGITSGYATTTK